VKLMAGIDLHSNNLFCGIMDGNGKRIFQRKLPCELKAVLSALEPYRAELDTIAVESTFNWYWLVDGLLAAGYHTVLANPAGMQPYSGLKHGDDRSDSFFLAELLRLGILPTGYICDRQLRSTRDLLRRRSRLVSQRTALMLSFRSLYCRMHGRMLDQSELKAMSQEQASECFEHPSDQLIGSIQYHLVDELSGSIDEIEKKILKDRKNLPCYDILLTIPGVGKILALTISLETADIRRFASPENYASYCRCVKAKRLSNGKCKGDNNQKCGNRFLGWAYVEAAQFCRRYSPFARQFYDRKAGATNPIVATKALACKLAKAAWHMMRHNQPFDPSRIFAASGGAPRALSPCTPASPGGSPEIAPVSPKCAKGQKRKRTCKH